MDVQIVTGEDDTANDGFEAFYRDHRAAAVRLAWLLTHDAAASEDVVQDAFTAVYRRFDSIDAPAAYLRRAVVNRVHELARTDGRRRRRDELSVAGTASATDGPSGGLADAVATLPLDERTVIVLRYWADLDHREIAAAMGIRPGTARSLLSRATSRLREVIER